VVRKIIPTIFRMFKITWKVAIILVIGIGLVLVGMSGFREGFKAGMPGIRCGVDLPTCSTGLQCMNSFCENPSVPALPKNELPVYP
jgi:hypothetical protein